MQKQKYDVYLKDKQFSENYENKKVPDFKFSINFEDLFMDTRVLEDARAALKRLNNKLSRVNQNQIEEIANKGSNESNNVGEHKHKHIDKYIEE